MKHRIGYYFKCINSESIAFTVGKWYKVIADTREKHSIIDNFGNPSSFINLDTGEVENELFFDFRYGHEEPTVVPLEAYINKEQFIKVDFKDKYKISSIR